MSQRVYDHNSWYEIKDNPISRVGVFPYLGASIIPRNDDGSPQAGYNPEKIYQVYRPAEELSDPDCMASFRLLPLVDEHAMLGGNYMPAEQKGVHGVLGENISFQGGKLLSNIKIFSNQFSNNVDGGKKELSAGYRCIYDFTPGVFEGQHYDAVQRRIRANHVALVQEGRSGPEIAVLDHLKVTFDAKEAVKMADGEIEAGTGDADKEMTLAEACAMLKNIMPQVQALVEASKPVAEAAEADAVSGSALDEEKDEKDKDDKDGKKAMDAALKEIRKVSKVALDQAETIKVLKGEIESLKSGKTIMSTVARKNALAGKIEAFVGTFDHAEKTLDEVASYGVEKLGLKAPKGQEEAVLAGYLHNRQPPSFEATFALDHSANSATSVVDAFINGTK